MGEIVQLPHIISKDSLQLFDISPDTLLVVDQIGNIIVANAQVERDFGYARSELLGHRLEMLLSERFSNIHVSHREHYVAALRLHPMSVGSQLFGLHKDKTEFPVDISLQPLLLDNTPHMIATIRNMTEQQHYEKFLSMAGHELRAPLTNIQIIAQIFAHHLNLLDPSTSKKRELATQVVKEALGEMSSQILRLNRLIDDLLDVSQIIVGHLPLTFCNFEIGEFVRETVEAMENTVNTHTFNTHGEGKQQIWADREQIRYVLTNFLNNAVKYSPEAQKVDIIISNTTDSVVVSVHDDGIGIAKEQQLRLFREYYRLIDNDYKQYGGFGVSLYIAASIVQQHNGNIWVESDPDTGATFSFSLPITA